MELLSLHISNFILKPFSLDNFVQVSMDQLSVILQSRQLEKKTHLLHQNLEQVTQEKHIQEKMLIQQSKLAQTGEMISMIAHQWRQPLASMTAVLASLKIRIELGSYEQKSDPYGSLIPDVYTTLDKIEDSVDYLSNTINDFRNFYRPDNQKASFDICTAMMEVLRMLNLEQNGVELGSKFINEGPVQIYSYEGELKQVFISIINNAVDALKEHAISEKKIFLSIKNEEDNILISIGDNAGGIPEGIIDDIFLPYFSTKHKKNGTGLGLHMAKNIIEEHMNGTLSVKNSTHCGGAEFTIKIPNDKNREET
jgi:signal transduction histidine kinase